VICGDLEIKHESIKGYLFGAKELTKLSALIVTSVIAVPQGPRNERSEGVQEMRGGARDKTGCETPRDMRRERQGARLGWHVQR